MCSIGNTYDFFDRLGSPFIFARASFCVDDEIYLSSNVLIFIISMQGMHLFLWQGVAGGCVWGGNNMLACCSASLISYGATFNFFSFILVGIGCVEWLSFGGR